MIKDKKEVLDDLVKTHKCPEHDKPLTVAWHATEKCYVLWCGGNHHPEEIVAVKSLTQLHKEGVELPETIRSNVERGMRKRQAAVARQSIPLELAGLPAEDLGTHAVLSATQRQGLVDYAVHYGLDAYRGHVMLMYGKPYIGIDGYLYHAHKCNWTYQLRSRPLLEDERKAMQLGEKDHGWKCEITTLPDQAYSMGIGIVTHEEMTEEAKGKPGQLRSPVVAAHPWQLAQKRAEWQALRRAFPIGEESVSVVNSTPPAAATPADLAQAEKTVEEMWPE